MYAAVFQIMTKVRTTEYLFTGKNASDLVNQFEEVQV